MGGRLSRTEFLKRQRNSRRWGNPGADPEVEASPIVSRSVSVVRKVQAHKDPVGMPSKSITRTENQRAWDK